MRSVKPGEVVTIPLGEHVATLLSLPWDAWCTDVEPVGGMVYLGASPGVYVRLVQHATARRATVVEVIGRGSGAGSVTFTLVPRTGQPKTQTFLVHVEGAREEASEEALEDRSVAGWRKRFDEQREQRG
jgi:hypothetical protein